MTYYCPACSSDIQPSNFGSKRSCAFKENGSFNPDNWNCKTIETLMDNELSCKTLYGDDESIQIITKYCKDMDNYITTDGFFILTRYKRRGTTSSIIWVGDFYLPQPVALNMVIELIDLAKLRKAASL